MSTICGLARLHVHDNNNNDNNNNNNHKLEPPESSLSLKWMSTSSAEHAEHDRSPSPSARR